MPRSQSVVPSLARLTFELTDAAALLDSLRMARNSEDMMRGHSPKVIDNLIKELEWATEYLSQNN